MKEFIRKQLLESADVKKVLADEFVEQINEIAEKCIATFKSSGKIMFCGNGGSAADSQHMATELVVRLSSKLDRQALPAIALTTDTSILTASGNDYGFDSIFARQVEALGSSGDLLVAISTSGNSANVLKAVEAARAKGISVVGFSGGSGGRLKDLADINLIVPSGDVQRIQEAHNTVGHIIIGLIEQELFGNV
jgi:D-sedoheptulose 7-phosphate isomerase